MEDFFQNINNYLSQLPWWIIAIGAVIAWTIFRKIFRISLDLQIKSDRKPNQRFSPGGNISLEQSSVSIVNKNLSFDVNSGTSVNNFELSLEGEDARKLRELIKKGNKIEAIKFIREKKDLDLVDAKNIVDAMSKL